MATPQDGSMTKAEIAEYLGVSVDDICRWARLFSDWFDICAWYRDKTHDQDDIFIFACIYEANNKIEGEFDFKDRRRIIEHALLELAETESIRRRRLEERKRPETARWDIVTHEGHCLQYEYEWIKPLASSVHTIANFGHWAGNPEQANPEPYTLLWTLEATKIVVIDKNPEYIQNAQKWLRLTRAQHSYFDAYDLEFITGDITQQTDLEENSFDLAYCENVLYYMFSDSDATMLQDSINEMARVVKPNGWVITIEPQMGVRFEEMLNPVFGMPQPIPKSEPVDIGSFFGVAGLIAHALDDAPHHTYCYRKPIS